MASSQIEIASSSPFGCVLRDHTRKERRREINVRTVLDLDTNFKDLVRDCISQNQITPVAMTKEQGNIRNLRSLRLLNNHTTNGWVTRQAQDVAIDRHVNEATDPLLVPSDSQTAPPTPSNLAASSLVQIWEARLNRSNSTTSNLFQDQVPDARRANSESRSNENKPSPVEETTTGDPLDEKIDNRTNNEDSSIYGDANAAAEAPSCSSSCDAGERERVRIADIIKKLKHADDNKHSNSVTDSQSRQHKNSSTSYQGQAAQRCLIQVVNSPRLRGRHAFRDLLKQIVRGKKRDDHDNEHEHEHSNSVIDSQSIEHKQSSTPDKGQAAQRSFLTVTNSPRIRGRQAFRDFLMRIERDKKRELDSLLERQSVSKFSQRGRLQSTLRLRSLQRSLTIQDICRPRPTGSTGAQGTRFSQGSTTMQLRGKFSSGAEQNDSVTSRCLNRDQVLNNSPQLDKSSTSKLQTEDQKASIAGHQNIWPVNHVTACRNENLNEQEKPPSHAIEQKETNSEARCLESLKTADATATLESQPENQTVKIQGSNFQQHLFLDSKETAETISSLNVYTQNDAAEEQSNHPKHLSLDLQETAETTISLNGSTENKIGEEWEQDLEDQHHLCLDSEEIVENATSCSDMEDNEATEELEDHYSEYLDQTDYDWFSSISRPRSYWEALRKAWYHEVLNTTSKNEEIRQLVQRGRVSTCLASDFRERIDRLMNSRVQIMQEDGAAIQEEVGDKDRMVQLKSYLRRHLHPAGGQGKEEEEEEAMSISSHQSLEANNYFNQSSPSSQMPLPSDLTRSWSSLDDKETGNDSDRVPSAFSPPPGASEVQYYQDTRPSSSLISPTSLEMELICELRGHIEQLQREMSELRKSIMSCMDMQMKWQQYPFNPELVHSGGREESKSTERAASPRKRSCCKCLEMQVDSVLYRCGHMCTCLKCAHELQWSSGKCPICGAPILDVVPIK
ncbi:hypothetical protein V6N13_018239 [Hibiscus sabdariffa]|uniref:RING-type domain-containing protein n=1 Tax=Hibiscus sabdariffa TaxID=183260 RepID=A0ABR2EML5_9ROSI